MNNPLNYNEDKPLYTIGVMSELVGLHPQTLRLYEKKGIIIPHRRNNQRLYSDRDVERLKLIKKLTEDFGINLAGVKIILQLKESKKIELKI